MKVNLLLGLCGILGLLLLIGYGKSVSDGTDKVPSRPTEPLLLPHLLCGRLLGALELRAGQGVAFLLHTGNGMSVISGVARCMAFC